MSYLTPLTGPQITKRVRDAVILNFREVFKTDPIYTYVENIDGTVDFDCSKVVINDVTPEDHFFLPTINVMNASAEEHRFLQEDFFEEFTESSGSKVTRRGAPMSFTVGIEALALDTVTRDELLDRMYEKLKLITDDLSDRGIGILRTSLRPDRRDFRGDRWFYTSGVDLHLYVEWLEEETIDPASTLNKTTGTITTDAGIVQDFKINNL